MRSSFRRVHRRLIHWRPGLRDALLGLVLLPFAGAATAAAIDPAPKHRYEAAGALAVDPGGLSEKGRHDRTRRQLQFLTRSVHAPPVLAATRSSAQLDVDTQLIRDLVAVDSETDAGFVVITARGRTSPAALALANASALETLDFARRLRRDQGGYLLLADFEEGLGAWAQRDHRLTSTPRRMFRSIGDARYGAAFLVAECDGAIGCGPATSVHYPFRGGGRYTASAWVQSDRPALVSLVVGASRRDMVIGNAMRIGPRWKRVVVSWSPEHRYSVAQVGVRTHSTGLRALRVDGVFLNASGRGRDAPASVADERRALSGVRYGSFFPAHPVGTVNNSTGRSALIGAAAGLFVAAAGLAAGLAANRR